MSVLSGVHLATQLQVAQVFGYSLSVTVDGQEDEAVPDADQEQQPPMPLGAMSVRLSSGAAAAAQQQRQQNLAAAAAMGRVSC
jgi:hypothetical protein